MLGEGEWNVESMVFSPDRQKLATGVYDRPIQIWDIVTEVLLQQLSPSYSKSQMSIVFSLDGQKLMSSMADRSLKMWDIATGSLLPHPLRDYDTNCKVAFSPDWQKTAAGSWHGTV